MKINIFIMKYICHLILIDNRLTVPKDVPDDLKELYKTAPVVEFNDDLLYWGRTKIQFNEFSGMGIFIFNKYIFLSKTIK